MIEFPKSVTPTLIGACVLLLLGGIGVLSGLVYLLSLSDTSSQIIYSSESDSSDVFPSNPSTNSTEPIWIDIAGAVEKPGVYQLQNGDRIHQVIDLAGGFLPSADLRYISQSLNLAEQVSDGQKVYIPFADDAQVLGSSQTENSVSTKININSASSKELQTLAGIGEVRAQSIIDGRPYSSIEQLTEKNILTINQFTKIKDDIRTY